MEDQKIIISEIYNLKGKLLDVSLLKIGESFMYFFFKREKF